MTNTPLPRPTSTPDMRARGRALLGAAQRKQDLYAQSLMHAEMNLNTTHSAPVLATVGAVHGGTSLDQLVNHITQAADQDLVSTHETLVQARARARQLAATDPELQAFMSAAYGPTSAATSPEEHHNDARQKNAGRGDVIDVQAREVSSDRPAT